MKGFNLTYEDGTIALLMKTKTKVDFNGRIVSFENYVQNSTTGHDGICDGLKIEMQFCSATDFQKYGDFRADIISVFDAKQTGKLRRFSDAFRLSGNDYATNPDLGIKKKGKLFTSDSDIFIFSVGDEKIYFFDTKKLKSIFFSLDLDKFYVKSNLKKDAHTSNDTWASAFIPVNIGLLRDAVFSVKGVKGQK